MQTLVRRRRMGDLTLVFRNQELNGTGEIIVYGYYHPYWDDRNAGVRNQNFDLFSRKILDLKCGNSSAIEFFYEMINPEINPGVTICVVPSSDPDNIEPKPVVTGLFRNGRTSINLAFVKILPTAIRIPAIGRINTGVNIALEKLCIALITLSFISPS